MLVDLEKLHCSCQYMYFYNARLKIKHELYPDTKCLYAY